MTDHPAIQSVDEILNRAELGGFRRLLYAAGALLMAMEGYDAFVVSNLAPFIIRSFDEPIAAMAFVFMAQSTGMAVGFYTIPLLADIKGRRGIILIGAAAFAILTLLSTLPGSLTRFAVIRFLTFVAFGGTMPNIVALVAEYMPEERRGKLLLWLFIAQGLGASTAGLIGPSFVAWHSWQLAFWFGGGALLLAIPFLYIYLPESCRYLLVNRPDDPRIGQLLNRIDPDFVPRAGTRFVTNEKPVTGSSLTALFRDGRAPLTLLLWLASAMLLCSVQTLTAWLPSFLHVLAGIEAATATRMMSLSAIGAILGPLLLTFLISRMEMARALTVTLVLSFLAMSSLVVVERFHALGWIAGICFGLLVVGSVAGLNAFVASSYPTAMRSTGIGLAGGLGRITSIVGPGLAGAMLAAQWSPAVIYASVAAPLLIAGLATAFIAIFGLAPRPEGDSGEPPEQ